MTREQRHAAILDLISTGKISSQRELGERLRQCGQATTQATLSRDLATLRVIRAHDIDGHLRYYPAPPRNGLGGKDRLRETVRSLVLDIAANESVVVIRTEPGHANAVAYALDAAAWPEVLGTVAGDDTIFLAPRSAEQMNAISSRLRRLWRDKGRSS